MLNILLELNDFCLIIGDDNPEDIFMTQRKRRMKNFNTNVINQIPCQSCSDSYIGMTFRKLQKTSKRLPTQPKTKNCTALQEHDVTGHINI